VNPIVFAGPSLHGADLTALGAIDIAPPAGCGDILKAVQEGRTSIGLIDGTFEAAPAVWHKEILYAIAAGCTVLGAASMGALRAAECERFGMVGIGQIFADYRDGRRQSDGDVALTHGPAELGHVPLSLALVDVEDALVRLHRADLLTEHQHDAALTAARSVFFKDRTWQRIFETVGVESSVADKLIDWLATDGPSLKTRDALLLLSAIGVPRPPRPKSRFISTRLFDRLRLRLEGVIGVLLACLIVSFALLPLAAPDSPPVTDGGPVDDVPDRDAQGPTAGLPDLPGALLLTQAKSADRPSPKSDQADEYRERCREKGVPVPTPIADGGRWSAAVDLSHESSKYLVFTHSAKVWTYRADDGGYCVAMLRETEGGAAALGTICTDVTQHYACFFDSLTYLGGKAVALSGDAAIKADFGDLVAPLDYMESCNSCHLGNNPFIVDPATMLGRVVESVYRLPDVRNTKSLHFEFVDVGNGRWINPPPMSVAPGSPEGACMQCHDFPSVRASRYCDAVAQIAPGRFMPPEWVMGGGRDVRMWPDPSTGCITGVVPTALHGYRASIRKLAKLCMPQLPDCPT
jgi:hypothetical protein